VPSGVACASEALCVAVDESGRALTSSNPVSASSSWSAASIAGGSALTAVSCAPSGLCVAVDDAGEAFVNRSGSWPARTLEAGAALSSVSCPSATLCVAVDQAGELFTSSSPGSGPWQGVPLDAGHELTAVSCGSPSLCVAVDDAGYVLWSGDPTGGAGAWQRERVDYEQQLTAVSCGEGGACVAVDAAGNALASADPLASRPSWTLTHLSGARLSAVSCAATGLCVATGEQGEAWASENAAAAAPEWSSDSVDTQPLRGVWCLASGACVAVDADGGELAALAPAPSAQTLAPTVVGATAAMLAGRLDPEGAEPTSCSFEYGPTTAYGQAVPCATLPSATGGAQEVTAQVGGLAPNSTYHYRLSATSARGAGAGADQSFTTAVSSQVALVLAHPSISGTPAVGQQLSCHAGTPAGSVAQLAYAWIRDQIPIAGATGSSYKVKGQDSGHHLQCQVTTTDGGGSYAAKSAFVSIPVGGVPASAGETFVGLATFRRGRLQVPVVCSREAGDGCAIAVRLSAPAGRGRTRTLAAARVRVARGGERTVAASLGASARRLLARRRRLAAQVSVSGTVIGVIQAQLSQQRITLSASGALARGARRAIPAASPTAGGRGGARAAAVLAATPYMGWDTYFALGGRYSEATVLRQASALVTLGLERRGFRYVWLDVGWWHGTRTADGQITVSAKQWPHGLPWLTRTLHAAGFRVGLYTDAGPDGCGGNGAGSYGHYQQDVDTFAAWGFDAVKVDFCGGEEHRLNPEAAYSAFHEAIEHNSSRRPMLLSICNFLQPEEYGEGRPLLAESAFASYEFGPSVGTSWRTDTDVGRPGSVSFADVLRNLDADAAAPQAAGPGHWNDPDYLAPGQGMSAAQFRSQLSMWAMLAAPLMISDNLLEISRASLAAVQDEEVLAVDQDPAGAQGTLLSSSGEGQVWVKPLAGGQRAVALLNRGSAPVTISTGAGAIGLPAARSYSVRNLWTHAVSSTRGAISARVGGDATVLLRVSVG